MKKYLILFLTFSYQVFSQQVRVSHELNSMIVGRSIPQRNDIFSKITTAPLLYWHCGYMINFEKPISKVNEKELSISAGFGAGVLPIALMANVIIPIFGIDEKLSVLSANHQLAINYAKFNKIILRGGYQAVYLDVSDYDFIDKYNYGFFIGGKANVGGRSFFCLDFNAQRFRHKDLINYTNMPQSHYLYGFTFRGQKYFK